MAMNQKDDVLEVSPATDALKASTRDAWDEAAAGWHRQAPKIRAWLAPATLAMLDSAGVREGALVLDVAAGAGDQTLDIARRVGPTGSVLATDLSPRILALAARNADEAGLRNVTTKLADGEEMGLGAAEFDAAVCRLGLMFFPDPAKGLREIHRALRPGARFCAMVFSEPQANPCVGILVSTASRHAGLPPPDPYQPGALFSLGRPGLIAELFTGAGFADVTVTRMDAPFRLAAVEDYVSFARSSAGPILRILGKLDDQRRAAAWAEIADRLQAFQTPTHWEGPNELLLAVGTRPSDTGSSTVR